jgi:copper transport protein
MAELRVGAPALPVPRAAVSAVVACALLAVSLRFPTFGLYAVDVVALVSAVVAAGLAFFTAILGDPTDGQAWWGRAVRILAVAGFAATLLAVAFTVMVVAGNGVAGLGDATSRAAVLRGATYESALARCAGLCAVAAAFSPVRLRPLRLRPPGVGERTRRLLMIVGGVLVAGSFLLAGHARSHGPAAVVMLCLLAHVVAVVAWSGGVAGVTVALRRRLVDPVRFGRVLVTFAGLMTGVIAMLLAGGIGLAVLYLSSWHALVWTAYGQVLIVKLGLVAALLVVSASNHFRLVRLAAAGSGPALAALRMNLVVEQIGLVTVLVITEVLVRQNPVSG